MTPNPDLLELAERCEKATGHDRAIEGEIHAAVVRDQQTYWGPHYERHVRNPIPHYTISLDAALTLILPGEQFGCGSRDDTGRAWAWTAAEMSIGSGATPALALCAAALKARARANPGQTPVIGEEG